MIQITWIGVGPGREDIIKVEPGDIEISTDLMEKLKKSKNDAVISSPKRVGTV